MQYNYAELYPSPVPGIPMGKPRTAPQPGEVIIGYQVGLPEGGCCKCGTLNTNGIIALVALVICCWPLAWLPCVMDSCHDASQYPVYGPPDKKLGTATAQGHPVSTMPPPPADMNKPASVCSPAAYPALPAPQETTAFPPIRPQAS